MMKIHFFSEGPRQIRTSTNHRKPSSPSLAPVFWGTSSIEELLIYGFPHLRTLKCVYLHLMPLKKQTNANYKI